MFAAIPNGVAGARHFADMDRADGAHRTKLELLIRPPPNMPPPDGYALYEGIIESDRWFGPLFTNLRLTRTHRPVRLAADFPLAQAQPLPREAYAEQTLASINTIPDLGSLMERDWFDYHKTIVVPNDDPDRAFGRYAVEARKRARTGCLSKG